MEKLLSDTSLTHFERVLLASLVVMPESDSTRLANFTGSARENVSRRMASLARRGYVDACGAGGKAGRCFKLNTQN